jgi:Fe2+ or Zn2+ uptake regulation protein
MDIKKGLKAFDEAQAAAVKKELKQLHDHKIVSPCKIKELRKSQCQEALEYLMFLKCERCGKIKACACAND